MTLVFQIRSRLRCCTGGQRGIDDHQLGRIRLQCQAELLGLARAEERRGHFLPQRHESLRVTSRLSARAKPTASARRLSGARSAAADGSSGHSTQARPAAAATSSLAEGEDVTGQPCGCACSSADGS